MEVYISVSVLVIVLSLSTNAQLIIPKRPLGYIYNNGSNDAIVHLDVHMGPNCPDSAAALPTLKRVAEHYGASTLKLTLHMFPLPYHHQAYLTAIGGHVVKKLTVTMMAFQYFDMIYANLDEFSNAKTANMSANDVIRMLSRFAGQCGVLPSDFIREIASKVLETETRAAWKYSCSRAIASTPTFLVNDVTVDADPNWTLQDWMTVIDRLLADTVGRDCPAGTVKCEYLPGKFQCCTKGEGCVPNVGCRCADGSQHAGHHARHAAGRTNNEPLKFVPVV